MLRIPADLEKGNQNRLLAMAPEFAEFLERIPLEDRKSWVFKLKAPGGRPSWAMQPGTISKRVCDIGRKDAIKVEETTRMGKKHIKFASAHDLRRSFGERWSMRVLPQVLMELMRHESITTTMSYYVGRNAERTADALWEAVENQKSNTFGNNGHYGAEEKKAKSRPNTCFNDYSK
jgi:integrase